MTQTRLLAAPHPTVYLDCIHTKVRDVGAVRVKAVGDNNAYPGLKATPNRFTSQSDDRMPLQ